MRSPNCANVMRLAEALARIQEDLSGNPELLDACYAIVSFIAQHDADQFKHLTYRAMCRMANLAKPEDTMPAVAYLTGERLKILVPRFTFIDDDHDEEISDEQMGQLLKGAPYHDEKGDIFSNPLDRVFTHFELSAQARELARTSTR